MHGFLIHLNSAPCPDLSLDDGCNLSLASIYGERRRKVCHRHGNKVPILNLVLPFKYFWDLENERNLFI